MADIVTELGLDRIARYLLQIDLDGMELEIGLYTNAHDFVCTDTIETLTECVCPGYARRPLDPANWAGGVAGCIAEYTYPAVLFGLTGNGGVATTVYGHFVIDLLTESVLWGATWSVPWIVPAVVTSNPTVSIVWEDVNCTTGG